MIVSPDGQFGPEMRNVTAGVTENGEGFWEISGDLRMRQGGLSRLDLEQRRLKGVGLIISDDSSGRAEDTCSAMPRLTRSGGATELTVSFVARPNSP